MASCSSLPHVVFPSFHRRGILSHLHIVFERKNITTFKDQEMERCQPIGSALIQAIRQAKASIVLISKNYVSSRCCLDELLEILKCKESSGQIVMPIFYDVDPSDVGKQKGDFGITFKTTCEGATEEKKRRWTEALTCVATITGEHSSNCADDAAMLEKISTAMLKQLKIQKVKEEFRIHDVDQNGFITKRELLFMMKTKVGDKVTDKQVRKIIKAADVDDDGQISYNEFVKLIEKRCAMVGKFATEVALSWKQKKEILKIFRPSDVNQNGFLTAADYQKYKLTIIGQKETDEDARCFIITFGVDCDGWVSYDEFVKLTR